MGSAFSQQQYVVAKPPTGRLTLTSGTPVMPAEAAAQTTIYYTPYVGAMVPIYDGTGWRERTFAELSLALAASANWASGSNYDLFVVDDGGTLRLLTGPAWTNDTTRSTAISQLSGLWVNDASMTGRYGASSTMTVGQYRGLYVGTVRMSANGTTTWELGGTAAGGDAVNLYLWNCYNQVGVCGFSGDSTNSWTTTSTTPQPMNNGVSSGAGHKFSVVKGLADDTIIVQWAYVAVAPAGAATFVALGLNSTSARYAGSPASTMADTTFGENAGGGAAVQAILGFQYIQILQFNSNGGTSTYYGDAGTTTYQTGESFATQM